MDGFVDTVVIGAGVVGIAIARAMALAGHEVIVLESASSFGTETSSRNSEVIHAGIYYRPGSHKARLCVSGKHQLYEYCLARKIPHRRCGKLIVATNDDEAERLVAISANAAANGVEDLVWRDAASVRRQSPLVRCVAALWSPSTGIIDSHALMSAMIADATNAGATFAYRTPATGGDLTGSYPVVFADGMRLGCRRLINSAGLHAQSLSHALVGLPAASIPRRHIAKGTYFSVRPSPKFDTLVYPVPASASLGIHVTIDMAGQVRLGPDQQWVDDIDYDVDPARAAACAADVRRYLDLPADAAFTPTYAGIRPKVQAPGTPQADFVFSDVGAHGMEGVMCLYGMESPGLTACLAIADQMRDHLAR